MVNSHILYNHLQKNRIELPIFRTAVAESLCLANVIQENRPVGKPSHSASPTPALPKPKKAYIPADDIRFDNYIGVHFLIVLAKKHANHWDANQKPKLIAPNAT
ncbi:hypothetical protein JTB14_000172 [Gonioctena quinquepunctata]|nr:hypothetical protein JTB14_000172 [Gonioctena quinquepunctata]